MEELGQEKTTITVLESDWDLLKDGVLYYKKKYEEQLEKSKPTELKLEGIDLEGLRNTINPKNDIINDEDDGNVNDHEFED